MTKVFVKFDDEKIPIDFSSITASGNDYVDQYRDLEISYKQWVRDEFLSLFITYIHMIFFLLRVFFRDFELIM